MPDSDRPRRTRPSKGQGLRGAGMGPVLGLWTGHMDVWASAQNGLAIPPPPMPPLLPPHEGPTQGSLPLSCLRPLSRVLKEPGGRWPGFPTSLGALHTHSCPPPPGTLCSRSRRTQSRTAGGGRKQGEENSSSIPCLALPTSTGGGRCAKMKTNL